MQDVEFQIPWFFAYAATFLWALSGAIVGMHKRYDITGVFVIALISSTGGGLLRDGLFLQRTPQVLVTPWYIVIILVATLITALFRQRIVEMSLIDQLVSIIDGLGVPAFAVVGMQLALQAGIALPGVLLVGMFNGFGGGLLRDVIVNETPAMLKPGVYQVLTLVGASVGFLILVEGGYLGRSAAAWVMIITFFVVRMLSVRYNWRSRPLLPDQPEGKQ